MIQLLPRRIHNHRVQALIVDIYSIRGGVSKFGRSAKVPNASLEEHHAKEDLDKKFGRSSKKFVFDGRT
ncbi:MAG: hypothetical protein ACKOF3_12640, partial [Spartobacteria bacterium]